MFKFVVLTALVKVLIALGVIKMTGHALHGSNRINKFNLNGHSIPVSLHKTVLHKKCPTGLDPTLIFCLCSPSADFLTVKFLMLNWRPVASWGLWEFVPGKKGLETCDLSSKCPAKLLCVCSIAHMHVYTNTLHVCLLCFEAHCTAPLYILQAWPHLFL